jgi:hypothetical protein
MASSFGGRCRSIRFVERTALAGREQAHRSQCVTITRNSAGTTPSRCEISRSDHRGAALESSHDHHCACQSWRHVRGEIGRCLSSRRIAAFACRRRPWYGRGKNRLSIKAASSPSCQSDLSSDPAVRVCSSSTTRSGSPILLDEWIEQWIVKRLEGLKGLDWFRRSDQCSDSGPLARNTVAIYTVADV